MIEETPAKEKCLICNQSISPFMSFGPMPIANGFLPEEQFKDEYFFEMDVAFCPSCTMFQLVNQPSRSRCSMRITRSFRVRQE